MRLLRWMRPAKPVEPMPITGMSAETQAAIITGLKQQRQRLSGQIDQADHDAMMRRNSAIQHDEYAAADRRAYHHHAEEARKLREQFDAIQRTINEIEAGR